MRSVNRNDHTKKVLLRSLSLFVFTNLLAVLIHWFITRSFLKHFTSAQQTNTVDPAGHADELSNSYSITRDKETPPLIMGPRRLHYIYATALPQTYLTLLSVLQGLVFGSLLLNVHLLNDVTILNFFSNLLQNYLYLSYIISSLVILIVWNQFVHGILFLAWPFTVFQSSLIFLMSLIEILTFTHVNILSSWLFGLGWIAIIGALIRFNNIRYLPNEKQAWIALVNNYAIFSKKTEILDGILYMSLGIVIIFFSIAFNHIISVTSAQSPLISELIKWATLISLFLFTSLILLIDKKNRRVYLKLFLSDSDLVASPHGIISYKREITTE